MVDITPFIVLVLIAVIVVIGARWARLPYTVALVVLGFGIGLFGAETGFAPLHGSAQALLAPGLFFNLLLPPIIFQAALHVNLRLLLRRAGLILFLAFVGVVFITLFTGVLVAYLTALPLAAALLLAAILSPTDPIAIVDLFRHLRVPDGLATIVESESLLNDAVGVVLFTVLVAMLAGGTTSPFAAAGQFTVLMAGGVLVGLLVAGSVYLLHRRLHDPAVETALSLVAAYGAFLLAQGIGASGIIACTIAGIAVGTWVAPRAMDAEVRHALNEFWSVTVYVSNSVIFLAMGLLFATEHLLDYVGLIAVVTVVLTLGRAAFGYLHRPLSRPHRGRLPDRWYNVIGISGIRGAIPVVLALSLLAAPPNIVPATLQTIVATVFGVAFVSIIAGNLVADWYVKRAFREGPSEWKGSGRPPTADPGETLAAEARSAGPETAS